MHIIFEVRSFNRFEAMTFNAQNGLIAHRQADTQTHRHTSSKNSISAIYSVYLADIIMCPRELLARKLTKVINELFRSTASVYNFSTEVND